MKLYDQIQEALAAVRKRTSREVEVGLILGSGLGGLADSLQEALHIPWTASGWRS
jgi:purine-nucleoside phosphorylase